MARPRKQKIFLPKPIYPGGPKALTKFIGDHLTYPEEAKKHKIEGTVVLRVKINYTGQVIGAKVRSGIGYGCDEEAQRVVKLIKFEIDSKVRRGKVLFHKMINIHFYLPRTQPVKDPAVNDSVEKETAGLEEPTQLSYTVKKEDDHSDASYDYTIELS
ncbi:MAG: energy transducer TonB [Saprospiraceae bacterium]|nr:energy transducer TonB [Saprospiraceae bacterium]